MSDRISETEIYAEMNGRAEKNGIVFFGTDFFGELPTAELKTVFALDDTVLAAIDAIEQDAAAHLE